MKTVLLSFDIEEFDMPLEYERNIVFEQQIRVSATGTETILNILQQHQIPATFFSTVVFASHAKDLIQRINNEGHELASHGYFHSAFETKHLLQSRVELERISGKPVTGFRMARMMPVDDDAIEQAGYTYNSSLNPVYLPGRYNNFFKPRTLFKTKSLLQLPASATPVIRFPLFWLSFHNLPLWLYKSACARTIHRDGYLNIYFHPWEFTDLTRAEYNFPKFVSKNTGEQMIVRFNTWIAWMKDQGYTFSTISDFLAGKK
ncbi:MAG TPA: polysaccharide deacetylase family protein [Ohtaekwangia sp.]|uniref:polysaccharide deacetylase family protein n=1 Tax=Ohtaekwangia sp. TaxID=2066019 RepID=UPI002F91F160